MGISEPLIEVIDVLFRMHSRGVIRPLVRAQDQALRMYSLQAGCKDLWHICWARQHSLLFPWGP